MHLEKAWPIFGAPRRKRLDDSIFFVSPRSRKPQSIHGAKPRRRLHQERILPELILDRASADRTEAAVAEQHDQQRKPMRRGNLQLRRKRPDPAVAHRKDGGEASIVQSRRDRHGQARAHISRLAGAKAKLGTPRPPDMLAYGAEITSVEHEPRFAAEALLDRG